MQSAQSNGKNKKKVANSPSTSNLLTFFLTNLAIFMPKDQLVSKCSIRVFKLATILTKFLLTYLRTYLFMKKKNPRYIGLVTIKIRVLYATN